MLTLHYIIIEVVIFFDSCYMIRYVQHYNYVQFSVECRKLFSLVFFRISTRNKWFKKNRAILLGPSDGKPKPCRVSHSNSFSRASRKLRLLASSFDWFTVFCVSFVIGFTTLLKTALRQCNDI